MNWESLTPLMEKAKNEVMAIKDVDERLAEFILNIAQQVEIAERNSCAKLCSDLGKDMTTMAQWGAGECAAAILSKGNK